MATGITGAGRLPEGDYSVSHRAPPPVPSVDYYNTQASRPPQFTDQAPHGDSHDARSTVSEGRRRGSFGFLRRSSSNTPATRIAQLHNEAALARSESAAQNGRYANNYNGNSDSNAGYTRKSSQGSRKTSGEGKMLRKQSKLRAQQEQERQKAEAAANAVRRQPPHLPSLNPLPNMSTFGGDDARPDSVAIFNNSYTDPRAPPPVPGQAANFSRPGAAAMAPSSSHNSSSPAYTVRGNAFAQQQSSSPAVMGGGKSNGEYVNSIDRSESMANRGRYSYASSGQAPVNVNSPRRVRRRKDPTPFNVLVTGTKNSGKTSFINFLRQSLALPLHKQTVAEEESKTHAASRASFTSHYLETEIESERVGLTLWDSAGLEKNIVDLQLREMTAFIEARFEETFNEEQKVMRSPGFKDTHIHCVFLVLDPVRLDSTVAAAAASSAHKAGIAGGLGGLDDDMDLQVMRALSGKTVVIPVISKADTLTVGHMSFLKKAVWESLKTAKLNPLEELLEDEEEDDEEEDDEFDDASEDVAEHSGDDDDNVIDNLVDRSSDEGTPAPKPKRASNHARQASLNANGSISGSPDEEPFIPMSILSPDPYDLPPYVSKVPKESQVGRRFPWGLASPYDPTHCDFTRLRDAIFAEWRSDLRELSRVRWYEQWRTSRLKNVPGSKQRIKGGVTPVAAVPREGRMSPKTNRNFSSGAQTVPRSASGNTAGGAQTPIGMAIGSPTSGSSGDRSISKAERMMGIGATESRGGTYRGVESYQ